MKFKLNKFLMDDIENKDHPSDFNIQNNTGILILRLPFIDVKKEKIDVASYVFLIEDKIYLYNRKIDDFEVLGNFNDLYKFLDVRIDKILAKLNALHIKIAKMEDALYDGEKIDFSKIWLECKKDLVLIERLIAHSMIAFDRFYKAYKDKLDEYAFLDLKEHLERSHNFAKSGVEKLDYLYEFYKTKQDEKMNNIMFVLTIISAIFLPLTLVTGFFGMNTGGLPFTNDPEGTLKVTVISVIFEIPFIVWLYKLMKK